MSAIHNLMGVVAGAGAGGTSGAGQKLGLIQSSFDAARGVASHLNNPTAGGVYTPAQVAAAMAANAPAAFVAANPGVAPAAVPAAAAPATDPNAAATPQTVKSGKPKDDASAKGAVEDHRIEAVVFVLALAAAAGGGFYFYKKSKKKSLTAKK